MNTIAIIAALDRELVPLVRSWQSRWFNHNGRRFRVYEQGNLVAVAGGIGRKAAGITARALVVQYHPRVLISAGVAGATQNDLAAGTVITPEIVFDSASGAEYRADSGSGALVTADEIADSSLKQALAARFHASAVDMEAAAVAQVAQQERIGFRCVKAISDPADLVMPPLNQFVDEQGQFRAAKFAVWAALRPRHWPGIVALARDTRRASQALCGYLEGAASRTLEAQTTETEG
jgi:nucleoside phosphorylase